MVKFAKKFINAEVVEMWDENIRVEISDEDRMALAWVVVFNRNQGDIPDHNSLLKIGNYIYLVKGYR